MVVVQSAAKGQRVFSRAAGAGRIGSLISLVTITSINHSISITITESGIGLVFTTVWTPLLVQQV